MEGDTLCLISVNHSKARAVSRSECGSVWVRPAQCAAQNVFKSCPLSFQNPLLHCHQDNCKIDAI